MEAKVLHPNGNTETQNTQDTANKADPKRPLLRLVTAKRTMLSMSDHYTDMGNAAYFIERQGQDVRYVSQWGQWLIWDGQRWAKDETGHIMELAKDTVLSMYAAAGKVAQEKRAEYVKHVLRSEQQRALAAMVELVKTDPSIAIHHAMLDADDMLLNVENGTIDLRTMELRPHSRADLITKLAPVTFDPDAVAPYWMEFLDKIMSGDGDLVSFLQEAIGVSLSGDTSDRIFIVLHGARGGNGKSTFLETVRMMLGEYGQSAPASTFIRQKDRGGLNNDIARLIGVRFCSASETEEGQHMADGRIKELTGGDTMSARFLHHEFFDFKPKATLFLATNHRPQVRNGDKAFWDRMRLVPFRFSFKECDTPPLDQRIVLQRFKAEMSGILNWALAGWAARQARGGICFPASMQRATNEYRRSMDIIGTFLSEVTVRHKDAKVKAGELYAEYKAWCDANGERWKDNGIFGEHLVEQEGLVRQHKANGNFYIGIGLRSEYGDWEEETPVVPPAPTSTAVPAQATLEQHAASVPTSAHVQPVTATTTPPAPTIITPTAEAQKLLDLLPEVSGDGNGVIVSRVQPSVGHAVQHYCDIGQPALTIQIDKKQSKTLSGIQLFNALAAQLGTAERVRYVKGVLVGLEAL